MLTARPLFPGTDDRDQILRIFKGLGTPTPASWPGMTELPNYNNEDAPLPMFPVRPLTDWVVGLTLHGEDFLKQCLEYEPTKRETAKALLTSAYLVNADRPDAAGVEGLVRG